MLYLILMCNPIVLRTNQYVMCCPLSKTEHLRLYIIVRIYIFYYRKQNDSKLV